MDTRSGELYPSKEEALAAGVPPEFLAEVFPLSHKAQLNLDHLIEEQAENHRRIKEMLGVENSEEDK